MNLVVKWQGVKKLIMYVLPYRTTDGNAYIPFSMAGYTIRPMGS